MIGFITAAFSAAALLATLLFKGSFPDRYESRFTVRAKGLELPVEVERLTNTTEGISASVADGNDGILAVECEAIAPETAWEKCTEALDVYIESRSVRAATASASRANDLSLEARAVDSLLVVARESLAVFKARQVDEGQSRRTAAEDALRTQREELQAQVAVLGDLISDLEQGAAGDDQNLGRFTGDLRSEPVAALVGQLIELKERRQELLLERSEINPDVVEIDRGIEAARGELRSALVQRQESLRSQIETLENRPSDYTAVPASTTPASREITRLEKEIRELEERRRELGEEIEQSRSGSQQSGGSLSSLVVSGPTSGSRSFPFKRTIFILGGTILGFGIATVLALREPEAPYSLRAFPRFSHAKEPAEIEGLPLVVIPSPSVLASLRNLREADPATPVDPNEAKEHSPLRREFERLLDSVWAPDSDPDEERIRVLGITSAKRGEGGTFVACNLALTSAASGARTLLVDGSTGNDGCMSFLGLPEPQDGWLQMLPGMDPDPFVAELAMPEGRHLHLLSRGRPSEGSGRTLPRAGLREFIRRVPPRYDLIVIDEQPAATGEDAASIVDTVDAIVLAVGWGSPHRIDVLAAVDRLSRREGWVLGAVLTAPQAG